MFSGDLVDKKNTKKIQKIKKNQKNP